MTERFPFGPSNTGRNSADLKRERKKQLHRIAELRHRHVLVIAADVQNRFAGLSNEDLLAIRDQLSDVDGGDAIDLILETPGGSGEAAEDIVRLIRDRFSSMGVIVPGTAKSAGTILAMARIVTHGPPNHTTRTCWLPARIKPLARLLRCATALRVTAPHGCGSGVASRRISSISCISSTTPAAALGTKSCTQAVSVSITSRSFWYGRKLAFGVSAQYMNDNILYHALARPRAPRPDPPLSPRKQRVFRIGPEPSRARSGEANP